MLVAPDGPSEPVADMQALPEVTDAEVVLAPEQLERDIAEIEIVRDRLVAEHAADQPQRVAGRSMARTSDYVPILVGGALAFTLLVVFGAAASFVFAALTPGALTPTRRPAPLLLPSRCRAMRATFVPPPSQDRHVSPQEPPFRVAR